MPEKPEAGSHSAWRLNKFCVYSFIKSNVGTFKEIPSAHKITALQPCSGRISDGEASQLRTL